MSALSKRQQARHERVLQQLLATVPGNDRCADCDARNPGWASWNLGIFLCLRCASLHRKMGTHISKVKSLSMDSWSSEQIENMKNNGNTVVNKIYNPRNVKPPMPIDMDEADSVMERYIRQKYEKKSLVSGKSESPARRAGAAHASPKPFIDDRDYELEREPSPPPLPPKGKKFGFGLRSVSSTFHLSSPSSRMAPRQETSSYQKESTPRGSLTELSGDTMEEKIESLRDLGFMDTKKNATVLKGLNGNVDKAVEALIRLGEGPRFSRSVPASKSAGGNGIFFDKLDEREKKPTVGITINKPTPAIPTGPSTASSTPTTSTNPFDMPPQRAPTFPLERSFQQMTLSNTQQQQQQPQQPQPLFPNNTGGFPSQHNNVYHQQASPQPMQAYGQTLQTTPTGAGAMGGQTNPFYQTSSPAAAHPQNGTTYVAGAMPVQTSIQPQSTNTNPFFTTPPAQSTPQGYGLGLNGAVAVTQTQPLHPMHTGYSAPSVANTTGSPFYTPSPQPQQQRQQQQQQQQQQQMPVQSSPYNPFDAMSGQVQPTMTMSPMPYQIQQQQQPPMQQQQQPQQPQQHYMPQRLNKESILSLYQFSQAPPTIYENQAQSHTQQQQALSQNGQLQSSVGAPVSLMQPPRRSATMPMLGASSVNGEAQAPSLQTPAFTSSNGFSPQYQGTAAGQPAAPTMHPGVRTHMSQESLDMSAWQSGRQSPDAFASLSARYAR